MKIFTLIPTTLNNGQVILHALSQHGRHMCAALEAIHDNAQACVDLNSTVMKSACTEGWNKIVGEIQEFPTPMANAYISCLQTVRAWQVDLKPTITAVKTSSEKDSLALQRLAEENIDAEEAHSRLERRTESSCSKV